MQEIYGETLLGGGERRQWRERDAGWGGAQGAARATRAVLDAEPLGPPLPPRCSLNQSLSVLGDTCPLWTL